MAMRRNHKASGKYTPDRILSKAQAERMIREKPQAILGWKALGNILLQESKFEEAVKVLEDGLRKHSGSTELKMLASHAALHTGNLSTALDLVESVIAVEPENVEAIRHLARIYYEKGALDPAEDTINKALQLAPSDEKSLEIKSVILILQGKGDEALEIAKELTRKQPGNFSNWNNVANLLSSRGEAQEAELYFKKSMELSKGSPLPFSNWIVNQHYNPRNSREEIFQSCLQWERLYAPAQKPIRPKSVDLSKDRRLRIGMISDGFRKHPVGWMTASAIKALPKHEIEIFAYSTNHKEDDLTRLFKSEFADWSNISGLSDTALYERIKNDKIDILIDLCGHNSGTRMKVVAMEPAPIVVKWVGGLINTTGVKAIDYLVSDNYETPEGTDGFYTEKIIRLPDDYICFTPPLYTPAVNELPALTAGHITFGCFNNAAKINEETINNWSSIMRDSTDSRLILKSAQYSSTELSKKIISLFERNGIEPERVTIETASPHSELLQSYNKVDIALDTWPYSGGLTTCEAFLMGVPVVTLPGPTFAGRHSATHLINAGMPELVVNSWDEYRVRVLELASDLESLATIRTHLRDVLLQSPVCDAPRFARHFSRAMRAIWQRYCESKAPAALSIDQEGQAWFEGEQKPMELHFPSVQASDAQDDFQFQFEGKIITLDHGGLLVADKGFSDLQALGVFATIAFDPCSVIKNAAKLQGQGELHHYPHVALGNGADATLYTCLDPAMTGTLEPLPAARQLPNHQQGTQVLARLPITTLRLDDIEGLDCIDWLLLDNMNDSLCILENGEKVLANTLLVQVRVNFVPTHKSQPELTQLSHWLSRYGFSFYRLNNLQYYSHLPARKDFLKTQATQLMTADALFIPSYERIESLSASQRAKLAFILHSVYSAHDISSRLLDSLSNGTSEKYLESESYIAPKEHAPKKPSSDTDRKVPGPPEITSDDDLRIYKENYAHELNPEVSIICLSYNHAKFIEDAIKGFIGQRTNFVFEVIIHDDASTDGTQDLIKIYAEKYPGLIVPILQEENQYSKKNSIANIAMKASRGKYIAICEGDDYWVDPEKIQKQYDFMEKNPAYSICYHDAFTIKEGHLHSPSKLTERYKRDYSSKDLVLNQCFVLTLSMFFRKCFPEFPPESIGVVNGDNFTISIIGLYGKGKYMDDIAPAAYRIHGDSVWSSISSEAKIKALAHTFSKLAEYHKRKKRFTESNHYNEKSRKLIGSLDLN